LKVFSAIVLILAPVSQSRRHIDLVTLDEGYDRLLDVGPDTPVAAENLILALAEQSVHCLNFNVEELFHGRFNLRLGRITTQRKTTLFCSDAAVAFSVITGEMITS